MSQESPSNSTKTLQAICYTRGSLKLLDQRKLPLESIYVDIPDSEAGWHAIKSMLVRGAPAIAVSGCLSVAVDMDASVGKYSSGQEAAEAITLKLEHMKTARPTAVNMAREADQLIKRVNATATTASAKEVIDDFCVASEALLAQDIADNKAIGKHGLDILVKNGRGVTPLTHCNTGSLATAGYGTALGIIRALQEGGVLQHAFCTETRPYNQGGRLTAYELVYEGIPSTLLCDSMVAAKMRAGAIDCVIVGADRVVANGDTANKIGTYQLAVLADFHKIPFFVAAPLSTLDVELLDGDAITIEERSSSEVTDCRCCGARNAALDIGVWNPAFDVTPAALITGVVTEHGVIEKVDGVFDVKSFVEKARAA